MRRLVTVLLPISILAFGLLWGITGASKTVAAGESKAVLLVVCEEELLPPDPMLPGGGGGPSGQILVSSSSSSTGDPAAVGADCAPVLTAARNGGFRIKKVTGNVTSLGGLKVLYTLLKKKRDDD